jgi:hypothetical protein
MLMKIAAAVLAVPVAAVGAVAATGVVVVDVREAQGQHFVVPLPLLALRVAAAFVPEQQSRVELGEAAQYAGAARHVLEALAQAPDCELVRVEEHGENVVIRKHGDMLEVRVKEHGGDDVAVSLPIAMALHVLPDEHGKLSAREAVRALAWARNTDLVDVKSANGDHVKIAVW